jgi:hypothetical protein
MNHLNQFGARLKLSVCLLALLGASESFANFNIDALSTELRADPSKARKIFQQQIRPILKDQNHTDYENLTNFFKNPESVTNNLMHLSVAKQKELITKSGEKDPDALFIACFKMQLAASQALDEGHKKDGKKDYRILTEKELKDIKELLPLYVNNLVGKDLSNEEVPHASVKTLSDVLLAFPTTLSIEEAEKLIAWAKPKLEGSDALGDLIANVLINFKGNTKTARQKFSEAQSLELYEKYKNERIGQSITKYLLHFLQTDQKHYSFGFLKSMNDLDPAFSLPIASYLLQSSSDSGKITYANELLEKCLEDENSPGNKVLINIFESFEAFKNLDPKKKKEKLAENKSLIFSPQKNDATPAATSPVTTPVAMTRPTTPAADTSVTKPSAATSVTKPSAATSVTKPSAATSVTKLSAATSVTKPSAATSVTKPSAATSVNVVMMDRLQKMLGNEYNHFKAIFDKLTLAQQNGLLKELNPQTNRAAMSAVFLTLSKTAEGLTPELRDQAGKLGFSLNPQC